MPLEFGHEGLTEGHHFIVRLPLRIEVGTPFPAAHGEACEAVLEHLLETEELQNGKIDGRMKPEPSLVGADGGIKLHTETAVYFYFATVIPPRDSKHQHPLRLDEAVQDSSIHIARILLKVSPKRFRHFAHRLMEFSLSGVSCRD